MENLITKYKKIKIFDNLYFYKFVGLIEDVQYDFNDQCIYYSKKGTKKCLYEIENIYFTISDEKYCFSEYLEKDQLKEIYQTEDENQLRKLVINDCKGAIKFGVFYEEKEILKLINSDSEKIKEAEPDSNFSGFYFTSVTEYNEVLSIPVETIDALLNNLEKNDINSVVRNLNNIKESIVMAKEISKEIEVDAALGVKDELVLSKKEQISNLLEQLNLLIGLKNVKEIVEQLIVYLDYIKRTKEIQNLENPNLNMVFKGNPGTGKTTIARILAKLLYYLGYARENKFVEITAQDLIAGYVGQTAMKTRKLLDQNRGGVIFLDEAYIMCTQSESYADEALVEILKEMETRETIFIFAGYQKEMTDFINMNPGFKSRIGSVIDFQDYTLEELFQIFTRKLNMHNLSLDKEAEVEIKEIVNRQKNKENFGNGRYINQLFDKIIMNHAQNCKETEDVEILKIISLDDLKDVEEKVKEKTMGFKV